MIRILAIFSLIIPLFGVGQGFNTSFESIGYGEVCASVLIHEGKYCFIGARLEETAVDNNFQFELFVSDSLGYLIDTVFFDFDSLRFGIQYNTNNVVIYDDDELWVAGMLRDDVSGLVNGILIRLLDNGPSPVIYEYPSDSSEVFNSLLNIGESLFVIGQTSSFGNGSNDYLVNKIDSLGIVVKDSSYGGAEFEQIGNAIVNDNQIILCGQTASYCDTHPIYGVAASNAHFICLDTNLNVVWEKVLYNDGTDFAPMIQEHGFFYYTLEIPSSQGFRSDLRHVYGRLDLTNGNVLWMDTLELADEITFPGYIESVDSNGFVIMCKVDKQGYSFDLTQIIKFNSLGEKEWERIYYDSDFTNNELNSMQVDDQGYLVFGGGYYSTITNSSDVWALKLGPDGCLSNTDCGVLTGILDLTPPKDQFNLKAFPNPTQELVQVIVENTGSNLNESLELRIYDLNGKLLFESMQKLNGQIPLFQIDVSNFLTGMYLVEACINGVTCGSTELIVK